MLKFKPVIASTTDAPYTYIQTDKGGVSRRFDNYMFIPTGEIRPPKKDEYFLHDFGIIQAGFNFIAQSYPIMVFNPNTNMQKINKTNNTRRRSPRAGR